VSAPAATAERPPAAAGGMGGDLGSGDGGRPAATATVRPGLLSTATLAVAGALCFLTFEAGGGLALGRMTVVEMALTLAGGTAIALAGLLTRRGTRAYGAWPAALLLGMTALSALSVAWSVAPDSSWQDAGRMLAYSAVFAAAAAIVRAYPRPWPALLGGIVLAAVAVCGYALLTKVLPGDLDAYDRYARLQEPYGYWNALGLTAALGAIGCLWLGARRAGHALVSAAAYPAMGLLLVTLMLAYSRGAIAALAVGVVLWMAIVPLRLRGARVLIVGALGAAPVVAWTFSTHALSAEAVGLHARVVAGRQLGVLLAAMLLALAAAGVAIGFRSARRPSSERAHRRAAALLVALLVVTAAAGIGGLAASKRGFTGTISHDLRSLTDPNAPVPSNTPSRLTAIGSVRARYWKEAIDTFDAHPALGVGASGYETARLRYRKETLAVKHAHGYLVQTLADLGLVGLAVTLALLAVWLTSAARATLPLDGWLRVRTTREAVLGVQVALPAGLRLARARAPYTPERIGLLSMLSMVVAFGAHSFADWTWYVPGNACVALLCAGWLAGRGPLRWAGAEGGRDLDNTLVLPRGRGGADGRGSALRALRTDPRALLFAAAVAAVALVAAWTEWQPQRSAERSQEALGLLARSPAQARAAARTAVSEDGLSAQALFTLATVQSASGERQQARATLQRAVRLQPSNPQTWLELGMYDVHSNPHAAVDELRAAIFLNPELVAPEAIAQGNLEAIQTQNAFVEALRAPPPTPPPVSSRASGSASAAASHTTTGTATRAGAARTGALRSGRARR
jgi:O-antigen ligase/polysaccharide polymerase Wzy-like membrane protein